MRSNLSFTKVCVCTQKFSTIVLLFCCNFEKFQMQGDMMEHRGRTSPVMLGTKIPGPQSSPALLASKQQGNQVRVLTLNHGEHLDSSLFR